MTAFKNEHYLADIYYHLNDLKEGRSSSHNVPSEQINCWLYYSKSNREIDPLKELAIFKSLHAKSITNYSTLLITSFTNLDLTAFFQETIYL